MRDYEHEELGDHVNYFDLISSRGYRVPILEFPPHVRQDKMVRGGGDLILAMVQTSEGETLHVVLISSFDGIHWFSWIIEYQRFDIMETRGL